MFRRYVLPPLVLLLLVWFYFGSVRPTLPPPLVVLGAGPKGGTYARHAEAYCRQLVKAHIRVQILYIGDSLGIIDGVNAAGHVPGTEAGREADTEAGCGALDAAKAADAGTMVARRLDIGFTAQDVNAARFPNVRSAGAVELQPLFLFHRGRLDALGGLNGRRVVMPRQSSATAEAARAILALYGVVPATIDYMQIEEAEAALRRGDHDAGFFMLSPASPMIGRLAADPALTLFSFTESVGISRRIDYLKPALLARGALDLRSNRPPQDVQLIGATVNVVVRKDLHPVVLYALLNAMKEVHRGQTLVSNPGDYPSVLRTALPLDPRVESWTKTGTPWVYENFPPALASLIDHYWGLALVLVALGSAFGTVRSAFGTVTEAWLTLQRGARVAARLVLRRLDPALCGDRRPGLLGRGLFRLCEPLLDGVNDDVPTRELLDRVRASIASR